MELQTTQEDQTTQQNSKNNQDAFQQALQESKIILQECQKQNNVSSCLHCSEVLECAKRSNYVKNVYLFLNQGQSESDFDF